jgi:hypothetical protein
MTTHSIQRPAAASGAFALRGDLPVHRLGFGAMRLTGPGVSGPPPDHDEAIRVLRRAVELGPSQPRAYFSQSMIRRGVPEMNAAMFSTASS